MNQQDIILDLFKYFARFVPKDVLGKMMQLPDSSRNRGYSEMAAEILAAPDENVIPDISTYIFSTNEKFVSDKVSSSDGILLYVEYGLVEFNPKVHRGIREKIAVHMAFPYSMTVNDNLNETLLMNNMYNHISKILEVMEKDQRTSQFCSSRELVSFPAEIVPIEAELFYNHTGWMAIFDHTNTVLL